jgi:hypothetical protein
VTYVAGVGFAGAMIVGPSPGMIGRAVVGGRAVGGVFAGVGASARIHVMPNLSTGGVGGVGGSCNELSGTDPPLLTPELYLSPASCSSWSCSSVHNCV